ICGSDTTWNIAGYQVTLSFVILFIGLLLYFHRIAQSLYLLFSAFTICLGYTGLLFWEQLMPVWMFMPRFLMISLVLLLGITMLVKAFEDKLAIGLLGIVFGEMYYSFILSHYGIQETIGDMKFFDMLFTLILMTTFLEVLRKARVVFYTWIQSFPQAARTQ